MTESIWQQNTLPRLDLPDKPEHVQTLVIGGGMAGLLCAYQLHSAGVDVVLVEQGQIFSGVSGKTTAKITMQHGLIYRKLLDRLGKERAACYGTLQQQAVETYDRLCQFLPCGYARKDAYVYARSDRRKLESEASAMHLLGFPAIIRDHTVLPFPIVGAVMVPQQGQMDPLQFATGIANGLRIFESTMVWKVEKGVAYTNHGKIHADSIVVATHFPFCNFHGKYFMKLYQQRSYVLALQGAQDVNGMYIGCEKNSLSFRNAGDLLLLGGGGHRTGMHGGGWKELEAFAGKYYPASQPVARWATQDCMSLDAMPYIGQYSRQTPWLYVATGFNKWGMTNAMVAANILTAQITGKDDPSNGLFSPNRRMQAGPLFRNMAISAGHLLRFTTRRCPHMGCALRWNKQEHSWDCPCHGSRFTEQGHLLDNPATEDLPE